MIISVPKETAEHERRVSLTPDVAARFVKDGHEVWIQAGAGTASNYTDNDYEEAGAKVLDDRSKLLGESDLILRIQPPSEEEVGQIRKGAVLICLLWALQNRDLVESLRKQGVTVLALEAIPRISRAQSMDVLSSMSSIAGYKSVLIGSNELDRYIPMMMTAAGTVRPATILILGAGVAGLQAIATAKRLGAVVEAFDVRPVVKEQVESLGAKFIEVPLEESDTETKGGYAKELSKESQDKQREVIHQHVKKADIVITTALIPGKKAPTLVTKAMADDMHPGAVVVDLAAEQGGNCELTEAGTTVDHQGVKIIGPVNLPSQLAYHASQLFAKNMTSLLNHLLKDGELQWDFEDEITLNTTITHQGELVSPLLKKETAS